MAFASNSIYGNGAAGIRIGTGMSSAGLVIRGNRLGVTASNSSSPNKAGNIVGLAGIVNQTLAGNYASAGGKVTVTLAGHGLTTGQRVYLEFLSGGLTSRNSAGFVVTRVDADTFTVSIPAAPATAGGLRVFRYGALSRVAQLKATNQFDFEGNQHGVSADAKTSTSSGGVVGGGNGLGRPLVLPTRR
jgi:hypothetical protein